MDQTDSNSSTSHELVDHYFRHEYAKCVSVLCRQFGLQFFTTIEDAVQSALLSAMQHWPRHGVPESPSAWINRVACNRAIDVLRHKKTAIGIQALLKEDADWQYIDEDITGKELPDSLLQMMFVCCHPALDRQSQIALSLKTLCGFSVSEIASGLLMKPETVKKRLQRARAKLNALQIELEQPPIDELAGRLEAIHDVLYVMFNEGYSTSSGVTPIRDDICEEATHLCFLLANHSVATPTSYALLALMLLHSARLQARFDEHGLALMLDEQDRQKWDQTLIKHGMAWLQKASIPCSRYHLEAYLAMQHVSATHIEQTNWALIISLYDQLISLQNSPVYHLNRAIAVAFNGDCNKSIETLKKLQGETFSEYYLLYCAMGKVFELSGDMESARRSYGEALDYAKAPHQSKTIRRHIDKLSLV